MRREAAPAELPPDRNLAGLGSLIVRIIRRDSGYTDLAKAHREPLEAEAARIEKRHEQG